MLAETVWVLRSGYRFERSKIVEVLQWLPAIEGLAVEGDSEVRAALAAFETGPADPTHRLRLPLPGLQPRLHGKPKPSSSLHRTPRTTHFGSAGFRAWPGPRCISESFDIEPLECSSCGGRMRFVEVIENVDRARSELRRRNLPAQPPQLSRARSPDWID